MKQLDDMEFGRIRCSGKKIYDKKGAQTICNYRKNHLKTNSNYLRIYQCDKCGYWHVTHTRRWKPNKWKKQ